MEKFDANFLAGIQKSNDLDIHERHALKVQRDGRRCNSSVHRMASRETPLSGIESSREKSFSDLTDSVMFSPPAQNLYTDHVPRWPGLKDTEQNAPYHEKLRLQNAIKPALSVSAPIHSPGQNKPLVYSAARTLV